MNTNVFYPFAFKKKNKKTKMERPALISSYLLDDNTATHTSEQNADESMAKQNRH